MMSAASPTFLFNDEGIDALEFNAEKMLVRLQAIRYYVMDQNSKVSSALMDHTLVKIKRLILKERYEFRLSAEIQLLNDGLTQDDALEAILNADYIAKKNSTSQDKLLPKEKVYIIESFTYDGILMYTKGAIREFNNQESFYIIISAKRSSFGA